MILGQDHKMNKSTFFDSPKPRSPFAFKKSILYEHSLTANRSLQVEKDYPLGITPFNATLPVQVVEALTSADTGYISCKLDSSGWAVLIKNRKLCVWKYAPFPAKTLSCTELHLPATELYHKADLTCILQAPAPASYTPKQTTTISIMNISPEGTIRYWPSLSSPGLFMEVSASLNGKECHMLTPIKPYGCILVTTTNDLLFLTPSQSAVTCKQFHLPTGLLSGISRRFSSFLLGGQAATDTSHLPKVACCDTLGSPDKSSKKFYVWSSGSLSKWEVTHRTSFSEKLETSKTTLLLQAQLMFQVDLTTLLKEEAARCFGVQQSSFAKVEPLDICSTGNGVALVAAVVSQESEEFSARIVFGILECSGHSIPTTFSYFTSLNQEFRVQDQEDVPELKLIIPAGTYRGFIYKADSITSVPVTDAGDECITVDPPGRDVIGAGFYGTSPIFLSRKNGFLTMNVSVSDATLSTSHLHTTQSSLSVNDRSLEKTSLSKTLNFGIFEGDEDFNVLARGFCEYAEGNIFEAQEIAAELTMGYNIDKSALKMSQDIVDSIPASDPRWVESDSVRGTLRGLSPSVIIMTQLQDKEKYHALFIKYLQDVDLWEKISRHQSGGAQYSTKLALLQNAEKIRTSMVLQEIYQSHVELLEKAFAIVVLSLDEKGSYGPELTNQDKVFQKTLIIDFTQMTTPKVLTVMEAIFRLMVSNVENLFAAVAAVQNDMLQKASSFKEEMESVMAVNNILTEPLKEAVLVRKTWRRILESSSTDDCDFLRWTASPGDEGLRNILRSQVLSTVEKFLPNTDSTKAGAVLAQQASDLADLLLDGYQEEMKIVTDMALEEAFKMDRNRILSPLVQAGYYEVSLELAEKYRDFNTLIALCEQRNDTEKMDHYKAVFADAGFLHDLYQWYIDRGQWQKLLGQESSSSLERFLSSHQRLRWLNEIENHEFSKASSTLLRLASEEKDLLGRRKTMLSISKLCLLASSQDADIVRGRAEEIEGQLALIQLQETLPHEVAVNAEVDVESMAPLSPKQLIELYTGDKNTSPDVYDFRRALDIAAYLNESEANEAVLKIWSRAILRDDCWSEQVVSDPVEVVSATFFGQCVLSFLEAQDPLSLVPSLDDLLGSAELEHANLTRCANFVFLLKAFYERYEL